MDLSMLLSIFSEFIFHTQNNILNIQNIYPIYLFRCTEESDAEVPLQEIRPHGSEIIPLNTLKTGDHVLMNYNVDYPKERGYWYDVIVKQVKNSRRGNVVIGDVSVGIGKAVLSNCSLVFVDDIYMIKPYELLVNRTPEEDEIMQKEPAESNNNHN